MGLQTESDEMEKDAICEWKSKKTAAAAIPVSYKIDIK